MNNMIKKILRRLFPVVDVNSVKLDIYNTQIQQRQLFFYYQNLKTLKSQLPGFSDTGFRVFSQNDEDGLLLYIFSQIGFTNKICIDMAFGSPFGANVTNLICNWGFTGLLVEGNPIDFSIQFFKQHPDTWIYPPKIIQSWITAENVNELCEKNGILGEIDLFSLDIDGVDYWIWKALDIVSPRIVVCEFANFIDADKSIAVPYKPDFNRFDIHEDFMGASLSAFVKLAKGKGYRLIGCNKYGFNAFFLRNDLGVDIFPEIIAKDCLMHPQAIDGILNRYPYIKDLPWVKI